ncbi:Gfo/Idh/MocA family protein [Bradyrhizobium guangzhouense]|uniref:Gfo/Idh/MocA family oxidoreductase n=1 Tax=Bradyrhizobium guangzhouense TaxID=1325095 RepID=A0AAE5X548_9BRAD|nr:Gfo/Idh/MocA family oxidoreductase [Bradyrhizobium guangzhouense]QAU48883.1 gfo/Idh/MocA family oxidoreductase [Bradyrhizobium guangzhouense]RXH06893.1 gfo/Idh/MocA family oxidoreductase [Bradyrhizobium guangzhouense]
MSKRRTVAVIGLGIGRSHIDEGYARLRDQFDLQVICDLNEERLAAVGDEFSVPRRTTSFDEVLAMDDIDIVDICTPPTLHFPQIMAALAAGKQVICEKPLVGSLHEVDQLAATEATSRGRTMPIFQYRFGNGLQKARRIIETGLAGKPYLATIETAWLRGPNYYAVPWRGRFETELGGALLTHAIHSHDILTWLMGDIAEVFARTATRVNAIEVEDCAVASLVMQSGALASLAATLGSAKEISRIRLCFEHVTFESSLSPYAPGDDPWQIIATSPEAEARIAKALEGFKFVPSRFEGLMAAYHQALETDSPLPVTLKDARRSLELITALYHAAETGEAVVLPIGKDHPKYRSWRPAATAPR